MGLKGDRGGGGGNNFCMGPDKDIAANLEDIGGKIVVGAESGEAQIDGRSLIFWLEKGLESDRGLAGRNRNGQPTFGDGFDARSFGDDDRWGVASGTVGEREGVGWSTDAFERVTGEAPFAEKVGLKEEGVGEGGGATDLNLGGLDA